ncbi:MAG: glycosyltransferase family 2 protein [Candidatus Helarchaeota archaeon]
MHSPEVSILMVLKNNRKTIEKCVKSVLGLSFKNFELIILDNDSTDGSLDVIRKFVDPRIRLFPLNKNLGYAAGNNYCCKQCIGKWLLIINPDIIVNTNLINELLEAYAKISKQIGNDKLIISPKIILLDNTINYFGGNINFLGFSTVKGLGLSDDINVKYEITDFFSGCCFLIKKEHFESIGGFDPYYFMYHEDVDFSIRARHSGFNIIVINTTKIQHMKYINDFKLTNFKYYMVERNRILTLIKNSPFIPFTILTLLLFEPILIIQSLLNHKLKMRALLYVNVIKVFKKYFRYNKRIKRKKIIRYKINFQDIAHFIDSKQASFIISILNIYSSILFRLFWKKFYRGCGSK